MGGTRLETLKQNWAEKCITYIEDTDLNTKKNMSEGKGESERQKNVLDLVIEVNVNSGDMSLSSKVGGENCVEAYITEKVGDNFTEPEKRNRMEDRGAYLEKVKTVKNRKETKISIDDEDIITLCDRSTKAVVRQGHSVI